MNDIDVLARPADLTGIGDIMMGMGYAPSQPICMDITLTEQHHLPPLVKKGHGAFEIHRNLMMEGKSYTIDPKDLWDRALPIHIVGCDALTLAPEDLLLHLCIHTSYHHQFDFGLRPSCDIAETIARFGSTLNWRTMTDQAARRGWQRGVYLALRMARALAGAHVPSDVLERLCPADMTEAILETVRAQIFTDKSFAVSIPLPFAEILESGRIRDKIQIFRKRLFLPKAEIAVAYSVSMDPIRILSCYPRRFVDAMRRYGQIMKKFHENKALMKAMVKRTNLIAKWLA